MGRILSFILKNMAPGSQSTTDDAESSNPNQTAVFLSRLEEYCSTKFFVNGALEEFVSTHAHLFDSVQKTSECQEKFTDYQELIERLLTDFVQEHQVSTKDVAYFCKLLVEDCEDLPTPLNCVDYILASLDYESFDHLMMDLLKMREWQCEDMSKYGRLVHS